jgi:hypothetical protein
MLHDRQCNSLPDKSKALFAISADHSLPRENVTIHYYQKKDMEHVALL